MLETCFTLEPGFIDLQNMSFLERCEYVYLLGVCFCSKDVEEIKKFATSRLWFTYRRHFPAIGCTGPTTDHGWGCMLRCGQMLVAHALSVVHLGRNWQWRARWKDPTYRRLLAMFQDRRTSLYSIHQIAQMGVSEGKPLGEWFGPNTIAQVLKKLAVYDDWTRLAVHVAMDNVLISDDVRIIARTSPLLKADDLDTGDGQSSNVLKTSTTEADSTSTDTWRPLLIVVPLRLGLTTINRIYLPAIQEFFKLPQCAGIIGGRPNHAVYFFGSAGDKLVYLDPHACQDFVDLDVDQEGTGSVSVLSAGGSGMGVLSESDTRPGGSQESPGLLSSASSTSQPETERERTASQEPQEPADQPGESTKEVQVTDHVDPPTQKEASIVPEPATEPATGNPYEKDEERSATPDTFDDTTYHCPYLMPMSFDSLDPSLALAFVCVEEDDYNDLVERLKASVINASNPPLFEVLEKRPRGWPDFVPYTGQEEVLKLKEFDDFGDPQFDSDDQFELLE
ncbi:Protein ATG-4.1 a [Aphelenchoides avenae]|nr:Protein ATG-4.1 a [Aphelenchus avenae]